MAQLNVRELRKQKQQKKEMLIIFEILLQLWKAGEFKPKKVCKSPTKHFQGSSDFSCDCFNFDVKHLSNHTDSSCRNLFTQEVPGKVTRDVVISYEVEALMTIFAKLFHFY